MKLERILLGLINLHPSVSGYELRAIINKSTGYFFTAALSQIYPALRALSTDGLITYEVEPLVGKQDRKVYAITADGLKALTAWLREPLELERSLNAFREFLLKLTFFGIMDDRSILAHLNAGLDHFESERDRLGENSLRNERNYIKMSPALEEHHLLVWSYENQFILDDLDLKIRWIRQLITAVEAQHPLSAVEPLHS